MPTGSQSESVEEEMPSTTLSSSPQATAMDICPAMAQVTTSFDIVPTVETAPSTTATTAPVAAAQATSSPPLVLTTIVDTPSADKEKQAQGSPTAIEPSAGSDSEKTVSEEIIGWRYGPDPEQKVIKNSSAKDTLLERIAPLVEKAEQAQGELSILRNEVAGYRNIRSDLKEKLRELIKEKDSAERKLAHAVVLNVKSHEKAKHYKDKLETFVKKHEELKRSAAKELSAMKAKHNEEFLKMKTELEEARRINAEFCQAAEPILDNLHVATAGTNISSFQTVIELLQSAPSRLMNIILESASVACSQTLAVIKSLYPKVDLTPITSGYADGTTAEKALELLDEVDDMAQVMAKDALYPEEENNDE
uniref:Uncharacterized protein n=1 Tax=Leersia perrieri TaxID=77586 RepID=A0A0D9X730_9ORYZ